MTITVNSPPRTFSTKKVKSKSHPKTLFTLSILWEILWKNLFLIFLSKSLGKYFIEIIGTSVIRIYVLACLTLCKDYFFLLETYWYFNRLFLYYSLLFQLWFRTGSTADKWAPYGSYFSYVKFLWWVISV